MIPYDPPWVFANTLKNDILGGPTNSLHSLITETRKACIVHRVVEGPLRFAKPYEC